MKRILFISPEHPWSLKTGYFYVSSLLISLLSKHFDVTSLSYFSSKPSNHPSEINHVSLNVASNKGAMRRIVSLAYCQSIFQREFDLDILKNKLLCQIKSANPDYIVLNHLRAAFIAPFLKEVTSAKLFYLAQNAEYTTAASISRISKFPTSIYYNLESKHIRKLEETVMNSCKGVIAFTVEDLARLQRLQRTDISVTIPPPIQITRLEPRLSFKGVNELLLVGSFRWFPKRQNALWFCREVFSKIIITHPWLKLTIVGAGAHLLQADLRNYSNIEIISNVDSVEPFFRRDVIFVVPERQEGGIKIKTCEAAACALPIVSTTFGVEGTGLRHGHSCVVADSPDDFADAIINLLDNPIAALKYSVEASVEARQRFSQSEILKSYIELFNVN